MVGKLRQLSAGKKKPQSRALAGESAPVLGARLTAHIDRVSARVQLASTGPSPRQSARVLIVDDERGIRDLLTVVLTQKGLLCETAANGRTALARAREHDYDLAILDLRLPDMSGLDLARTLRQRQMRILFLSGLAEVEDVCEAVRLQADDFLLKPVAIPVLLAAVERALARCKTLHSLTEAQQRLEAQLAELGLHHQRRFLGGVVALATALEARDSFTKGHSLRVSEMCITLGTALHLSQDDLDDLVVGALLHDVGKIAVPDAILLKPGPLTRRDRRVVHDHPQAGRAILLPFFGRGAILTCALCHHERWDGRGYPQKLTGEAIPLPGRIVSVCDAFDAITSERPYRPALSETRARNELRRHRGQQFDPAVVDAFFDLRPFQNAPAAVRRRTGLCSRRREKADLLL